jgi:hypothetical protein
MAIEICRRHGVSMSGSRRCETIVEIQPGQPVCQPKFIEGYEKRRDYFW